MDDETKQRFDNHEERIKALEGLLGKKVKAEKKPEEESEYSGLRGGIKCLVDESFLDTPKSADEVHKELVRRSYHYPKESVREVLSRHFMQARMLTRVKVEGKWAYAKRK